MLRVTPLQNEIAPKNFNSKTKRETKSGAKNLQKTPRNVPDNFRAQFNCLKVFHRHFFTVSSNAISNNSNFLLSQRGSAAIATLTDTAEVFFLRIADADTAVLWSSEGGSMVD